MKFAYLIIAHTKFDQVAKLLELLDDERNDLYIHIDQKVLDAVDIFQKKLKPAVKKSELYFVEQHNVMWGGRAKLKQNWSF